MSIDPSPNPLILEAQADFALNLLREVSTEGRSSIVSPFSVAIALSMVYAGAKGTTGEEMGQLLAKGEPESDVHKYFGDLFNAIQRGGRGNYTLEVADKVYVKKGFELLDAFKQKINENYGGQFEAVNFANGRATAKKINNFVEEATHNKIRDLISPDVLDDMTRLVLINAVYFKGNWVDQFRAEATRKKPFYVDEKNSKELDMMHKRGKFIYYENKQLQLLGMPYKGNDMFMFVLLPKERFGLTKLLDSLDGKTLLELIKKRDKEEVQVALPKFKLESTHELNKALINMGLSTAFSDSANFEGITKEEPLKISDVLQKAFIEVNEEGTEAAAATALTVQFKSLSDSADPPPSFVADRPFVSFLLQNSFGDVPLFGMAFRG